MHRVTLQTLAETAALARQVAPLLTGGTTVGFIGPLGAGKTTLIRELALALGSRDDVSSPTFVLSHEYQTDRGMTLEHWDLYRLGSAPLELREPPSKQVIRLIEWIDRDPNAPTELCISLEITSNGRVATLSGPLVANLDGFHRGHR